MSDRVIVCLVGSTRFREAFAEAFYREEHAGRICLTVPCYKDDGCCKTPADHAKLDLLHLDKIRLSTEVLVLDCERTFCKKCQQWADGDYQPSCGCGNKMGYGHQNEFYEQRPYIGSSTRNEIAFAESLGKKIRYLSAERSETHKEVP